MQIRSTITPDELQEAARMSRPTRFWLRFFAANWYSTAICLLIVGVAIHALVYHEDPRWGSMAVAFMILASFIGFSWYRWNANLSKIAEAASARSGTFTLDPDGVRTILASGSSTFVPWSSYDKWTEGKSVFLLTGKDGTTIIPIDGNRESLRGLLVSKIS